MNEQVSRAGAQSVQYHVDRQSAEHLNNVARDQYNQYIQQIRHERESFARSIAATRTSARRLIWVGFALFVVGIGTYGWAILRSAAQIQSRFRVPLEEFDGFEQSPPEIFGPEANGIPVGLIGFAVAGLGMLLMVVGMVLHIVATSRRRQLESSPPPAPPPWQAAVS